LRLYWELYGGGSTSIVLLPASPIVHSRLWKPQIHYLARRYRVVVFDGRGNGRSDDPDPTGPWLGRWRTEDCLAVLDATETQTAVLVGICVNGVWPSVQIAADHPERVLGIVALAPGVPLLAPSNPWWETEGAGLQEQIRRDHRSALEFFFGHMFPEPHSTKHVEDAVAYGLDGRPSMLLMEPAEPVAATTAQTEAICRRVRCPVLVVQGERDNCQHFETGLRLAELTGAEHVRIDGGGHLPNARHPVLVNQLIHAFASRFEPRRPVRRTWVPAARRPRRALLVSSPIGLGHAWRDVAIARELRRIAPDVEVHWLAQHPLTTLLDACGEIVHPASADLAPEAKHVDAEAGEHALNAFQMLRRLDEIFCANFMVFHDLVSAEPFDVWIGDEAWELDYFLHENPELKTTPYVWLTDFVGVVPMPEGGAREAFLAADHNAQMVEHVARRPHLRDRSIFIGDREDVVDAPLGPGLPRIPEWTQRHFRFSGYITGFDHAEIANRDALRSELGFGADEKICIVAAGGSGAGMHLLERAVAALPEARERVPELRMVVVAGPSIDPKLISRDGVEAHGYVHRLYRHLAACDIAVCHGGLSTTMELTAARRPFLYFPLRGHFEQNHHVAHRLERHGAGRRMSYATDGPSELADAIVEELGRVPRYRAVPDDGAARAAAMIAELL
jgi:pimeloyl-ACP methyl ester carboxylesterase/UDP:flavonoid glycosyltransferase YjiC (YdhE family)